MTSEGVIFCVYISPQIRWHTRTTDVAGIPYYWMGYRYFLEEIHIDHFLTHLPFSPVRPILTSISEPQKPNLSVFLNNAFSLLNKFHPFQLEFDD